MTHTKSICKRGNEEVARLASSTGDMCTCTSISSERFHTEWTRVVNTEHHVVGHLHPVSPSREGFGLATDLGA